MRAAPITPPAAMRESLLAAAPLAGATLAEVSMGATEGAEECLEEAPAFLEVAAACSEEVTQGTVEVRVQGQSVMVRVVASVTV